MNKHLTKFRGKPTSHPITPIPHPINGKKSPRRYRKPLYAHYDQIINDFLEGEQHLMKVEHLPYSSTYLYHRLQKRIDDRKLRGVLALTLVNDVLYMERLK